MGKNTISRIKNKLFSGTNTEKTIYSDLAPTDSLDSEQESLKALHWAISNPQIRNIALAGPYGAGKSSVIRSYLRQHPKCKAIDLSLATFDGKSWDKVQQLFDEQRYDDAHSAKKEFEDEVERGILKQLFYKVDASRIPLSRYRKLHHINIGKYIAAVMILTIVALSGIYLAFPSDTANIIASYKDGIASFQEIILRLIAFAAVLFGAGYIIRYITSKFTVKEISIGDISAQGDMASNDSVLNRNIDEMLYFFERTKYNVVFIEDLDRFNSTSIFIKLREINTILNQYDVIRKRGKITFVYAVKDDLFQDKTERTKFFDFLIPVIPIINSTNSGEIMRNLLGMGEWKEENKVYPEHGISEEFVTLVSPYIGDMRILINTMNEFWIYKKTIKENQDVHLDDKNMLALMIYKNMYPKDFALLESESGDVKDAFRYKSEVIKKMQENLNEKKARLETETNLLRQDIAASIKEIKILILSELVSNNGVVLEIKVSDTTYKYKQMLEDSFTFDIIRKEQLTVHYYTNNINNPYRYSHEDHKTITNIEESTEQLKDLFQRYDRRLKLEEKTIEDTKKESEKIDNEIMALKAKTVQQLLKTYPLEDVLPENVRDNNLLVFMLRHGYINETYADYINYFHPGSITREELNFILWVRDFKGKPDFSFVIKHCANVIGRLYDYEFSQVEVLNFTLTDYLIGDSGNKDKLQVFIKQLTNQSDISLKYIEEYMDRREHMGKKEDIDRFIHLLFHETPLLWMDLMYDEQLSTEKKNKYFKLMISICDLCDIKNNNMCYEDGGTPNGVVKDYFESQENILLEMSDIPWQKIKQVIDELGVKFYKLNLTGLGKHIIDDIIEGRYFELNHPMMEAICSTFGDMGGTDKVFKCNYQWLCELGHEALLGYVHDEFLTYVRNVIIGEESNTEEGTASVNAILQKIFEEDKDLSITVIEKEHLAYWGNLTDCLVDFKDEEKKEVWNCLLQSNRTDASWDNYLCYHDLFGLTGNLFQYFNKNIDAILGNTPKRDISDEIVKELITENLPDDNFKKLISNHRVSKFSNELSEFSENKLKILIQEHYFEFTPEKLAELKEISRSLSIEFISENVPDFLENLEQCDMDLTDIKEIIKLRILNNENILRMLKLAEPTDMDKEFASLAKNHNLSLPKEYAEAIWQILEKQDKDQFLYDQMEAFDLDEIAEKFGELGGVYEQFSSRIKRKYNLHKTEFNEALCHKLQERGFLSSREITEDKHDKYITGYVKKKPEA